MKRCKTSFLAYLNFILVILIKFVSSVQYNQPCTFSFGTCDWSIGRRWHIVNFNDEDKGFIKFFNENI